MTAIENKEIKGITAKLLYGIIGSTGFICGTFMFCYSNLLSEVKIIRLENKNNIERIEKLEAAQGAVINQVNLNSVAIGKLQK